MDIQVETMDAASKLLFTKANADFNAFDVSEFPAILTVERLQTKLPNVICPKFLITFEMPMESYLSTYPLRLEVVYQYRSDFMFNTHTDTDHNDSNTNKNTNSSQNQNQNQPSSFDYENSEIRLRPRMACTVYHLNFTNVGFLQNVLFQERIKNQHSLAFDTLQNVFKSIYYVLNNAIIANELDAMFPKSHLEYAWKQHADDGCPCVFYYAMPCSWKEYHKSDANLKIAYLTDLRKNLLKSELKTFTDAQEKISDAINVYTPLHPHLFSHKWNFNEILDPAFLAIVNNKENGRQLFLQKLLKPEIEARVYSFKLFTDEFCEQLYSELKNYEKCEDAPKQRPNSMNNYGVILNYIGLRPFIDALLEQYLYKIAEWVYPHPYSFPSPSPSSSSASSSARTHCDEETDASAMASIPGLNDSESNSNSIPVPVRVPGIKKPQTVGENVGEKVVDFNDEGNGGSGDGDEVKEGECNGIISQSNAGEESKESDANSNNVNNVNDVNNAGAGADDVVDPDADLDLNFTYFGTLDYHHTFMVEYNMREDRFLDMHIDDSNVTFNVNLCDRFTGAQLAICGLHGETVRRKHMLSYSHVVGRCLVHSGRQRHGARSITSGERQNLIIWCRSSWYQQHKLHMQLLQQQQQQKEQQEQKASHAHEDGHGHEHEHGHEHGHGQSGNSCVCCKKDAVNNQNIIPDMICLSHTHDTDYAQWVQYHTMNNDNAKEDRDTNMDTAETEEVRAVSVSVSVPGQQHLPESDGISNQFTIVNETEANVTGAADVLIDDRADRDETKNSQSNDEDNNKNSDNPLLLLQ